MESVGQGKVPLEDLSKDEIISKYKVLLGIAKQAKKSKDEFMEENRQLKELISKNEVQREADKKSLLTMKEMLEQFTENKLQMATQINELQRKSKADDIALEQLKIENESLKRQLERLTEDNDSLLNDIDRMEDQLKQVNVLGIEQKKHLSLLELEVNKLKETESLNASLKSQIAVQSEEFKSRTLAENTTKKALEELEEKYRIVKQTNSEQCKKFNALKDRFVDVHRKLKNLKECRRILLETQHEYADAISKWQKEIIRASQMLCAQMNALKAENNELLKKLDGQGQRAATVVAQNTTNVQYILQRLQEMHTLTEQSVTQYKEKSLQLIHVQEENDRLKHDLQMLEQESHEHAQAQKESEKESDRYELEMKCRSQELTDLKNKLSDNVKAVESLKLTNEELEHKIFQQNEIALTEDEQSKQSGELQNMLLTLKHEKSELLAKLQNYEQGQGDKKVDGTAMQGELLACRETYEDLVLRYEQKEREHSDLLGEMRELNEALKVRGDVISRQQEKQQELIIELKATSTKLRQIEDSLNEKEDFILKKDEELRRLSKEIEETHVRVSEFQVDFNKNEEYIRELTEELNKLRNAESANESQNEIQSTSTISQAEELTRMREVDESFEERYNKLRGMAVKLKKKLQEQTTYVAEMEKELSGYNALKAEMEELKKNMTEMQKDQQQNAKLIESLKSENQRMKTSRKQANVLSLEIEAAEKSLTENIVKLAAKAKELQELNYALTAKEQTIVQLHKEIAIMEAAKEAECVHSKELKEQVDHLQMQIKDEVHSKQVALDASKELEQAHEGLKLEFEKLSLELANCVSIHESKLSSVHTEKEQLAQQLLRAEETLKETQGQLKVSERSLENLRVEYLEYKVKAQAVLRKNQTKDTTRDRELEEELLALKAAEKQLEATVQTQIKKIEESDKEIQMLHEDNENLQWRNNELLAVVEELRQQNETWAHENRCQTMLQQESLKNQRQQIEKLDNCHTEQLKELEGCYTRQIEQLKAELAKAVRVPTTIGASKSALATAGATASNELSSKIDFLLMDREDAEGSDEAEALASIAAKRKISNITNRSQPDIMSLDELLNAPMHTFVSETVIAGNDNAERTQVELEQTKERLQIQESRLRHLTALLAENEQDLAKLTQMNDMLKEELRRQERTVERDAHMHNSEYLKNVIVKFLTLNNTDERTRLVPVLNTILKLSRSETEMLNCVAKGQKVSTDNNNRAWSNFLTSWSNNN